MCQKYKRKLVTQKIRQRKEQQKSMNRRKIRTTLCKVLAGVLIGLQLFGAAAPMQAHAAEETVYYVALGDSITAGNDTYVSIVANYLENKNGDCVSTNLGVSGWSSEDLLAAMTDSTHAGYAAIQNALKKADVITLDIGSNDIVNAAYETVADCFGCEVSGLEAAITSLQNRLDSKNKLTAMKAYIEMLSIARSIRSEFNSQKNLNRLATEFQNNYTQILAIIASKAPQAKVYIGNLYNPYYGAPSIYMGGIEVVDTGAVMERSVTALNNVIANYANGNTVVDIYSTINSSDYIQVNEENYDYNPHPNSAGQRAIANKFIEAMK